MTGSGQVLLSEGKVRSTYSGPTEDILVMVASDRVSVYDVVLNEAVPGKGIVLTHMTEHWLTQTPVGRVAPNHFMSTAVADLPIWARPLAGRTMVVRRAEMLPIELIVRGYLTGSAWKSYRETGLVNGVRLPAGMREMDPFLEPMFTPSTKAEQGQKDENITIEEMARILGNPGVAAEAKRIAVEVYQAGAEYALQRGIIVVDTKFELGWIDDRLALCDEVLTPDSSRFVDAETYKPGQPPKSMDKQLVRDWADKLGWNHKPPPPTVPPEVISQTQQTYGLIAKRLTGVNPLEQ